MTTQEFHDEFNILYNNVMSNQAMPLDEYEISIFLTRAQEQLISSIYNPNFESNELSRRLIANLIKDATPEQDENHESFLSFNSKAYNLPEDMLVLTHEFANIVSDDPCLDNKRIKIVPVTQDQISYILDNPFRTTNERRALRLDLTSNKVEIISKYDIDYKIRYLRKPKPIILKDLEPEGVSINGQTKQATSELDTSLDLNIITIAVELAKHSYGK